MDLSSGAWHLAALGQRDLYANINNQVLHFANQGVTINQIHNVYEMPKGIAQQWYNRGYHGSPEHNSRGGSTVSSATGKPIRQPWSRCRPADSAPLYVEMMSAKPLSAQIEDGTAKVEDNTEILSQLAATMVVFDPRFEILPGTKGPSSEEDLNDFEVGPIDLDGE